MNKAPAIAALCVAVLLGIAAAATAQEYKKCPTEVSVCVRQMAGALEKKGWVGIEFESAARPVITRVVAESPAAAAGVEVGDLWVGLDDLRWKDMSEGETLKQVKASLLPDVEVRFIVVRGGAERQLDLTPTAVPEHLLAQWIGKHVLEHHMAPAEEEVVAEQEEGASGDD